MENLDPHPENHHALSVPAQAEYFVWMLICPARYPVLGHLSFALQLSCYSGPSPMPQLEKG